MIRRTAVALATLALAAGLTACGASKPGGGSNAQPASTSQSGSGSASKSGTASGGGSVATGPVTIVVKNFEFTPGNVTVKTGTTVTWKFEDTTAHNVAANDKKFKSKDIQTGSYQYKFNSAGSYDYICTIHQYMKGTVTVQ